MKEDPCFSLICSYFVYICFLVWSTPWPFLFPVCFYSSYSRGFLWITDTQRFFFFCSSWKTYNGRLITLHFGIVFSCARRKLYLAVGETHVFVGFLVCNFDTIIKLEAAHVSDLFSLTSVCFCSSFLVLTWHTSWYLWRNRKFLYLRQTFNLYQWHLTSMTAVYMINAFACSCVSKTPARDKKQKQHDIMRARV